MIRLLFGLLFLVIHAESSSLYLSWASDAKPNETVLLSGSGFTNATQLLLKQGASQVMLTPLDTGLHSLAAVIPAATQLGIYSLQAVNGQQESNALHINQPKLWWVQGRCGNFTVPGGWLRAFGSALCIDPDTSDSKYLQDLQSQAHSALIRGDYTMLRQLSELLSSASASAKENPACSAHLQLRTLSGARVTVNITSDARLSNNYEAFFTIPLDVAPGEYQVLLRTQLSDGSTDGDEGWVPLDSFISPGIPHMRSIVISPDHSVPSATDGHGRGDLADSRSFGSINPCEASNLSAVFDITDFLPLHTKINNPSSRIQNPVMHTPAAMANVTRAVQTCLKVADANGGGTCYFPRGKFWIEGQLIVPPGVYLRGAGMSMTALYWQEYNNTPAACNNFVMSKFGYITPGKPKAKSSSNGSVAGATTNWGLADMSIYVTAYYRVFLSMGYHMGNTTDGFRMIRVRVRANAYFGAVWGPYSTHNRPRPNVNFNFTQDEVRWLIQTSGTNYEIRDCDLYATSSVLTSGDTGGGYGGNSWGWVSGNKIWNGQNAHRCDQWKQVIFEHNTIVGISLTAAGNNVASYNGGYAQHLHFNGNSYQHVWGGDREVMTYDNAGGAYFGPLTSAGGDASAATATATGRIASNLTIKTLGPRIPLNRTGGKSSVNGGGWVVVGGALLVLNGTGAGQVRRLVANTDPYTWTLDRPLDAVDLAPAPSTTTTTSETTTSETATSETATSETAEAEAPKPSFVQLLPYRGRNIWWNNSYEDTGAFQFYGIGIENVVSHNTLARVTGMVNWGQWRQWHGVTPAPPSQDGSSGVTPASSSSEAAAPAQNVAVGGEMGCGANPNMRNLFESNEFTEGNALWNWNTAEGANYNWGHGFTFATGQGGGAGGSSGHRFEDLSMNMWLVYRKNKVASNGGMLITDDATAVIVEGNSIEESALGIHVDNTTENVLLRGNEVGG